jgi:2-haloacid dehalogenase
MAQPQKHVVFDVVGTCVEYSSFINAIDERLGDKLRAEGIKPRLLAFTWIETAEREYTYLSITKRYKPSFEVMAALFYRMLYMGGIEEPRQFATDEDRDYILQGYSNLTVRPGVDECFRKLRDNGFTVWCLTAGDTQRVHGYLTRGKIDMPVTNFISCDSSGVGKPDLQAYRPLLETFGDDQKWFAAAHMWDVSAAKMAG